MSETDQTQIEQWLSLVVDPVWYREHNHDVRESGVFPLHHFIEFGLVEQRDPNAWFDGAWYLRQNTDIAAAGAHPLLHYLSLGAAQGRDPHPRFDAAWYVRQHPEAVGNPLLFHLRVGVRRGWPTGRRIGAADFLPSLSLSLPMPRGVPVDVIVPVYRDMALTKRCLDSLLADSAQVDAGRPEGRIIVIEDESPEPALVTWLIKLARGGAITLLRNPRNLGFVASVNRGMTAAGDHDVALLNSDTEVPSGWLARLQAQAYARPQVASVSPLSNNATICSYPAPGGGPMPEGMTLAGIDAACRAVNAGRFVTAPTTVGFCMYIRRAALDAVGLFDADTFGAGYGEENDFCLRATALGWTHHIACDTFVWHQGGVSFGESAAARVAVATRLLLARHPAYETLVVQHVQHEENAPYRFAMTMALFRASDRPTILLIMHDQEGGVRRHVQALVERDAGQVNYLLLRPTAHGMALSVPALADHPIFDARAERWRDLIRVIWSAGVSRARIHHLMGHDTDIRALLHELDLPFDVVAHDYFAICPQVTLLPWPAGSYCGEPGPEGCDACIASRPSHGATDILSWRLNWSWQFREAETVFTPSVDMLNRLKRYGVGDKAVVTPF